MSTIPGESSWRDAGLRPVDPDEPLQMDPSVSPPDEPEDYEPDPPLPDSDTAVPEADLLDQSTEIPIDDEEKQT